MENRIVHDVIYPFNQTSYPSSDRRRSKVSHSIQKGIRKPSWPLWENGVFLLTYISPTFRPAPRPFCWTRCSEKSVSSPTKSSRVVCPPTVLWRPRVQSEIIWPCSKFESVGMGIPEIQWTDQNLECVLSQIIKFHFLHLKFKLSSRKWLERVTR